MKTVFLAWQAPSPSRAWYPIGRLDAEPEHFRFRYTEGALKAERDAGLRPLYAFPDFKADYESPELFPLFQNRVLSPRRPDFGAYMEMMALDREHAGAMEILSVSGGERATDNLEVFPRIRRAADDSFTARFFLHGIRHLPPQSVIRCASLIPDERLRVMVELDNPVTRVAIALHTNEYEMIGWAPRYLVPDIISCVPAAPALEARIIRLNPPPAPANRRVLVELTGKLPPGADPMSGPDFRPLA